MKTIDFVPYATPEWHEARKGKITASIAPAILCPPEDGQVGNPLTAWLDIVGRGSPPADNEHMAWGRESEELHARMLAKVAGVEMVMLQPGFAVSPDLPWLGASTDAIAADKDGLMLNVQTKAPTNIWEMAKRLRQGVPRPLAVQVAVERLVLGADASLASVLVPPGPIWQRLERSPELEQWILEGLERFWKQHVEPGVPPEIDAGFLDERALEAIKEVYQPKPGTSVHFSEDSLAWAAAQRLENAKATIKQAERDKTEAEAALIQMAGTAQRIYLPNGCGYVRQEVVRPEKAREAREIRYTSMTFKPEMS